MILDDMPRARGMLEDIEKGLHRREMAERRSASKGDGFEMVGNGFIEHHVTSCSRTIATTRLQHPPLPTAHLSDGPKQQLPPVIDRATRNQARYRWRNYFCGGVELPL